MIRSKTVRRLLRALLTLLGAGLGVAIALGAVQLIHLSNPAYTLPIGLLVGGYIGMACLGAALFFLLSNRMLQAFAELGAAVERRLSRMSLGQIVSCTTGLISGLIAAALLTPILAFMGNSMFTAITSCILYLVFGLTGLSIGQHRADEVSRIFDRMGGLQTRRFVQKKGKTQKRFLRSKAPLKLLDSSVLIDGRIAEVYRTGFLEGELSVPCFVLDELRRVADSADATRRAKGRRGLDVLEKLQALCPSLRVDDTDFESIADVDAKLLRLAKKRGATLVTGDQALGKAAQAAGVKVLNLNDLAGALRPAVLPGEEMNVAILKEGKEPGQGVAYLSDGTMIVVEGGRSHMGETVRVTVTTALQTSAGRMIFAKLK